MRRSLNSCSFNNFKKKDSPYEGVINYSYLIGLSIISVSDKRLKLEEHISRQFKIQSATIYIALECIK